MVDDGAELSHWRSYLRTSAPWIGNLLLLPSHSNHVNGTGGYANPMELFVLPGNERWYATRAGQVQFVDIDLSHERRRDDRRAAVGRRAGRGRARRGDDPTFVIASWHHPACSSQYYSRTNERTRVQDNLVARVQASGGVDLILAAHDKYYERSEITGGIVLLITNIKNVPPEIPGGNHPACTAITTSRTSQSVALFTVEGPTLSARVLDQAGAELDTFTIAK